MKTPTYTQTHRHTQRDTHTANQATTNKDTSKNKKQVQQNQPKKRKTTRIHTEQAEPPKHDPTSKELHSSMIQTIK